MPYLETPRQLAAASKKLREVRQKTFIEAIASRDDIQRHMRNRTGERGVSSVCSDWFLYEG